MLHEYDLIGERAQGGKVGARNLPSSLFPEILWPLAQDLPSAEDAAGNTEKLKETLVRTLVTKRAKLQQLYQRKRQIKLVEKRQKQQEKALSEGLLNLKSAAGSGSNEIRCTLQAWDRRSK